MINNKFFVYYTHNNEMKQHIKGFVNKEEAMAFAKAKGDNLVMVINEKGKKVKVK